MRLFTPFGAHLWRHSRSGMQTCTMCFEALPIARPTPHGRPVQSPTKYRTKCGQICRLRVTAESQTAHTYTAMSTSRSGTAAATRNRFWGVNTRSNLFFSRRAPKGILPLETRDSLYNVLSRCAAVRPTSTSTARLNGRAAYNVL